MIKSSIYPEFILTLARLAEEDGYKVIQSESRPEAPFHDLHLIISQFNPERIAVLRIYCLNELHDPALEHSDDVLNLQLFSVLPVKLDEKHLEGAERLLEPINKVMPVGAFNVSRRDAAIYYKYGLVITETTTAKDSFKQLLGNICSFFTMFVPEIYNYASGTRTLQESFSALEEKYQLTDISVLPYPGFPEE